MFESFAKNTSAPFDEHLAGTLEVTVVRNLSDSSDDRFSDPGVVNIDYINTYRGLLTWYTAYVISSFVFGPTFRDMFPKIDGTLTVPVRCFNCPDF